MEESTYNFSELEWKSCIKVLQALKDNPLKNPDNKLFGALVSKIHKQAKKELRSESYKQKKSKDLEVINNSEISRNAILNKTLYQHIDEKNNIEFTKLNIPKNCYCCNSSFDQAHFFYNRLCPKCAYENYSYRDKKNDLSGRKVIITGSRVKIGYSTTLKLLRSGAHVVATTRFPAIALSQFQKEKDYSQWSANLLVYGLDLRNLKMIEQFIQFYNTNYGSLDILINNAAQTIKYPDSYYLPVIQQEKEQNLLLKRSENWVCNIVPILENKNLENSIPCGELSTNRFGQPVDQRVNNSWNSTLEEIDTIEMLEVNLINHIAPYLLIKGLTPHLKASNFSQKFIINVTSSEGQFSYANKSIFHPHTNMTKAALNMLTRTSAVEYEKFNIYMNAVDVGWVSTGAREDLRKKQFEKGYIPPLDSVDGASRIMHPIFEALENNKLYVGKLLKNQSCPK